MSAVERARELGTEHGREAAEAWLDDHAVGWAVIARRINRDGFKPVRGYLPKPYASSGDYAACEAYEAAFTEAVETTIRERCSS